MCCQISPGTEWDISQANYRSNKDIPGPGKKVESIRGSVKQETTKDNH